MSVKQENRCRMRLQRENNTASDIKRDIEAAFMVRNESPGPANQFNADPVATRAQVRRWMRNNASHYDCDMTWLAEAANAEFNLPDGAMDDETHWVWDESFDACEACEALQSS